MLPNPAEAALEALVGQALATRPPQAPLGVYVRDVTLADISLLDAPIQPLEKSSAVQRLRHTHHQLARLVAQGTRTYEISAITGFTPGRISQLKGDPAFEELVAFYKDEIDKNFVDIHARLATVGTMALEEVMRRLDEEPEKLTTRELKEIIESTMDRSVAPAKGGPKGAPGQAPAGMSLTVQFVQPGPAEALPARPIIDVTPE